MDPVLDSPIAIAMALITGVVSFLELSGTGLVNENPEGNSTATSSAAVVTKASSALPSAIIEESESNVSDACNQCTRTHGGFLSYQCARQRIAHERRSYSFVQRQNRLLLTSVGPDGKGCLGRTSTVKVCSSTLYSHVENSLT